MKGVEAIAQVLQAEGIEFVTCFPLNQILDSAAALKIRPLVSRTERVAVNIADGYSRMMCGKKIGVSVVQYGPGAENAFGGIAQAYGDSTPLLCLAGSLERARLSIAPNFKVSRNFKHITKWTETVTDVQFIPQMMQRAFALLRSGKPGPVLLEFPTDVMLSELQGGSFDYTPPKRSRPLGDPMDVREAVDALISAKAPVLVAGQGVLYSEAWDELKTLAELLQIPVASSLNGKSAFPENHSLALGALNGFSRPRMVDDFLKKADLVFGVGTSFTISKFITQMPTGKTIAQVTIDESDISKDYPTSYGVIGDAKAVLVQMIEHVQHRLGKNGRRGVTQVATEIQSVKKAFLKEWMPRLTSNEEPISPYRVIWELMHSVDPMRSVVTHDSGCPRDQLVPFYEAIVPHGYIGWGKSTPLGSSLGLTMGAKLAKPDWLAIHLMGDAAFGMVGMDFETAVRNNIPILTILMNNGVMGGYTKKQPMASELFGVHRLSGDYKKVAEGLGGYTERVEKVADLRPSLERAIQQTRLGSPVLLEIITADEPIFPGEK
ncbi:MAG: thiamine pyrophosphate-requiring protein [Deltaproteobacteria bacterium]|nr:thiamine pyrophosphate-requiring protein [Deltaproteobacteria bacterium]